MKYFQEKKAQPILNLQISHLDTIQTHLIQNLVISKDYK